MIVKKPYSFKIRLLANLLISALIPLILIGYISYYTIFSLLNNNIEDGIQKNLKQISISITYAFNNLESSSLQLSVDNVRIADKIDQFLKTDNVMYKYTLQNEIIDSIAILNTVRPDLGTIFFYLAKENEVIFENQGVDSDFSLNHLPIITEGVNYSLFGPHATAQSRSSKTVFSILRKVYLLKDIDLYVYMETNFKQFEDLLNSHEYDLTINHILVNHQGQIVYSQNSKAFPVGTSIDIGKLNDLSKTDALNKDYYVLTENGPQGWYALAAINKKDYNFAINKWVSTFFLFAILSVVCSALLAYSIWRMVYRPLRRLNTEIGLMAENKFNTDIKKTGIYEFDNVLDQFQYMKSKIVELFKEIEEKERKKRIVEIQNLLHQINPHFLHNTLNTIQWLARINGQDEIDRLAALFARVLHYNLGKEGGIVQLREEIEALKDYIELHKYRYDHQFNVMMKIDDQLMDTRIPRFIMQPMVENAIHHGLKYQDGNITIDAQKENNNLVITVKDDGSGINEEDIKTLLAGRADEYRKGGMGIGLSYVKNMLDVYYGEEAMLDVRKNDDKGTTFSVIIPIKQ